MPPTSEPAETGPALKPEACFERTRAAVLNVLVAVGFMIAVSGAAIRAWPLERLPAGSQAAYRQIMTLLFVLGVASYATRRLLERQSARAEPSRRDKLFFWAHVLPAVVAALAVPLGLYCGWYVDPRLGAVSPFWVIPLALGFLALPRQRELENFEPSTASAGAHEQ
jgi:hypothetical protein